MVRVSLRIAGQAIQKEKTVSEPIPAPPAKKPTRRSVIQPGNTAVNTDIQEKKVLADLLALPYQSFSVDQIISCEKEYGLNHFHYVDVVLRRIVSKRKILSVLDVERLWNSIRQDELEYFFLSLIPGTIKSAHKNTAYQVPETKLENPDKVRKLCPQYQSIEFGLSEDYPDSCLTKKRREALFNGECVTLETNCRNCWEDLYLDIKLTDATPCFELTTGSAHPYGLNKNDHTLPHQHGVLDIETDQHADNKKNVIFPLSTYSKAEVVKKMKECVDKEDYTGLLCFHVVCTQKYRSK